MATEAKNMVQLKTSSLVWLSIAAGIGFSQWYTIVLDTVSVLAQRIVELVGAFI